MGELGVELWQLELRYAALRTQSAPRERRLLASLVEVGQQVPIVVLAQSGGGYVVVDGYKRVRCARRLVWDTVRATSWDLGEADALILERVLRSSGSSNALEEGWYLKELAERFGLSLQELSRRFSRSKSWISRRLSLVAELPEDVQQGVLSGQITPHGAMRYLVPLARANRKDCSKLYELIRGRGLSSRQLGRLWAWYLRGGKGRELVLESPDLVLRLSSSGTPQEALVGELVRLRSGASRARGHIERGVRLVGDEWTRGRQAVRRAHTDIETLLRHFDEEDVDAGRSHADGGSEADREGARHAADRAGAFDLARSGTGGDQERTDPPADAHQDGQGRGAP